ncbi:hypothetical protein GE09DRAFT_633129 [Coniochaeta sp. 2T2.1]|nr:hypothetical protein GE09DRAFT_633129 [Coniochaeta sp. 2T2.1]
MTLHLTKGYLRRHRVESVIPDHRWMQRKDLSNLKAVSFQMVCCLHQSIRAIIPDETSKKATAWNSHGPGLAIQGDQHPSHTDTTHHTSPPFMDDEWHYRTVLHGPAARTENPSSLSSCQPSAGHYWGADAGSFCLSLPTSVVRMQPVSFWMLLYRLADVVFDMDSTPRPTPFMPPHSHRFHPSFSPSSPDGADDGQATLTPKLHSSIPGIGSAKEQQKC